MAKTDWQLGDTVLPEDLNQLGQEINDNASAIAAHVAATTDVHDATPAATANRIVLRDADGRAKVAAPAASDDIARKDTVDAVQTNLNTHKSTTRPSRWQRDDGEAGRRCRHGCETCKWCCDVSQIGKRRRDRYGDREPDDH
jgi:hypothetical protein